MTVCELPETDALQPSTFSEDAVSFKLVSGFVFFGVLSVYLAFLNPQDIDLRLTQSYSLKLPVIVLLLASIVVGVLIAGLSEGLRLVRGLPAIVRLGYQRRRRESRLRKCAKLYEEAENALISGNLKKAGALFEKILSLRPDDTPALNHLGDILRREGKFEQALEMHARAARLAPHNVKIHCALAEDHAALNQYEKAVEVLKKIQESTPDSLVLLRRLRDAWLKIPDWEQAVLIQKTILRLSSYHELEQERERLGEMIYGNAVRYFEDGDSESAKAEFKRSIKEGRNTLPAFITLGDIYFKENSRKDALKIWKAGYNKTRSPICLQRIQWAGDDDIVHLCEKAVRVSRNSCRNDLAVLLATVFLENGESEKAVKALEETADNASLLHQILLITARQASNCNGHLPDAAQAIFRKIKQALSNYTCNQCLATLQEWSGYCPSCKSWDSIVWEPQALNAH